MNYVLSHQILQIVLMSLLHMNLISLVIEAHIMNYVHEVIYPLVHLLYHLNYESFISITEDR
jgi:hypothetical protein